MTTKKVLIDSIINNPLFKGINREDMSKMLDCLGFHEKSYTRGEFILLEEDNISHIGIILTGSIDMIKEDIWGDRNILVRMKDNDIFGESFACSADQMSSVSFQARSKTDVIMLPFNKVVHNCNNSCVFHHRLIENMVELLAEKNRRLIQKSEIVSRKTLREKLMAYLSMQSQEAGSKSFIVPIGRVELAEYISADRSAITRELNAMRDEGIIDFKRNSFTIL